MNSLPPKPLPPTTRDIATILRHAPYRIQALHAASTTKGKSWGEVEGDGRDHFARFAAIHGVLAQEFAGPVRVVNNGPGKVIAMEAHMARLRCLVTVKEPRSIRVTQHKQRLAALVGADAIERSINYLTDLDTINQPTPADIVYWLNPDFGEMFPKHSEQKRIAERIAESLELGEEHLTRVAKRHAEIKAAYLSRDVVMGGYLVVQTDIGLVEFVGGLNPRDWQVVYTGIKSLHYEDEILPTWFAASDSEFGIFKRIG